jgi:hypothetical protein
VGRTVHVSDEVWVELSKLKVEVKNELQKQGVKRRVSYSDVIAYLVDFYRKSKSS